MDKANAAISILKTDIRISSSVDTHSNIMELFVNDEFSDVERTLALEALSVVIFENHDLLTSQIKNVLKWNLKELSDKIKEAVNE